MKDLKLSLPARRLALLLIFAAVLASLAALYHAGILLMYMPGASMETTDAGFVREAVDAHGPHNPWGKAAADLNGDGLTDLIVGGHDESAPLYKRILGRLGLMSGPEGGELVWYESPSWVKRVIARGLRFGTDIEVVDIDGDGDNDVVSLTDRNIVWFRNPDWLPTTIDSVELHDIETGDFDSDGDMDIAGRNQSAYGGHGDRIMLYYQSPGGLWEKTKFPCPEGEGLKAADMNGDGLLDLVVNGRLYENPGTREAQGWREKVYAPEWNWPHTAVEAADINGDGLRDIVLTPSEKVGSSYRISWFEAPPAYKGEWKEHVIDGRTESVDHSAQAADMDNDGDVDIVTAEMHQGGDPDEVRIYVNGGAGAKWTKRVVSTNGSHNLKAVDIDGDGDMDMFGANWSGDNQTIDVWINLTCHWNRHLIDSKKPWRSVFVTAADMDGDGIKDIVTGGWWYKNPGKPAGKWRRRDIGKGANNMAAAFDIDGDADVDILATDGKVSGNLFVWARNDGHGTFEILENIPPGKGDFLQGVAVDEYTLGERGVAVSWHEPGWGIQILEIPKDPGAGQWAWSEISPVSEDEALSAGDIDGDGDADLLLGTKWLRNDGGAWKDFAMAHGKGAPDRNRMADINRDGLPDAVVGFEAISEPGKVAWYEQGAATFEWKEHVIGVCIGPMSLDAADMDGDGDLDVVVGEHNLARPEQAALFIFWNVNGDGSAWEREIVYVGDEHHDGAYVVDIDNDGDNDIVSIGWGHSKVLLYENKRGRCDRRDADRDR